jgi:hypothetical protein
MLQKTMLIFSKFYVLQLLQRSAWVQQVHKF